MGFEFGNPNKTIKSEETDERKGEALAKELERSRRQASADASSKYPEPKPDPAKPEPK